jgi:DNA polymerase III delta prime subunit
MNPTQYVPKSPADFIGPAAGVATLLSKAVVHARSGGNDPLKFLFNGPPGVGKSELVRYLQCLLGCDKWSTTKFNGTQIKLEVVEEIAASLHYKSLFNDYRLVWIDEADQIPRVAQCRFLTLLDELPAGAVIACTSNCKLKEFEDRFQSRFQVFEVERPSQDDIAKLLGNFLTDAGTIQQIATFACGNVRQALLDAQSALQMAA